MRPLPRRARVPGLGAGDRPGRRRLGRSVRGRAPRAQTPQRPRPGARQRLSRGGPGAAARGYAPRVASEDYVHPVTRAREARAGWRDVWPFRLFTLLVVLLILAAVYHVIF